MAVTAVWAIRCLIKLKIQNFHEYFIISCYSLPPPKTEIQFYLWCRILKHLKRTLFNLTLPNDDNNNNNKYPIISHVNREHQGRPRCWMKSSESGKKNSGIGSNEKRIRFDIVHRIFFFLARSLSPQIYAKYWIAFKNQFSRFGVELLLMNGRSCFPASFATLLHSCPLLWKESNQLCGFVFYLPSFATRRPY